MANFNNIDRGFNKASFDTTLGVRQPGPIFHPSIFQAVPGVRGEIPAVTTQPQRSPSAITQAENDRLYNELKPVIEITLDNVVREKQTTLFIFFFSEKNVAVLQKSIRYTVFKWSGYHIGYQSKVELIRLMEDVFMKFAKHINELTVNKKELFRFIYYEVSRLNNIVIQQAVPQIIDQVEQFFEYVKSREQRITSLALSRPTDNNVTGTTLYRSHSDILSK